MPRVDARAKATGAVKYAGDIRVPGMLFGRILRSPYAHARIKRIDTKQAKALPGVHTVLTGKDVLDINPYYGHAIKDRPLIAIDKVRFVGEPVVAVAAETLAIADEALDADRVEYEELPLAVTLDAALADGRAATPHHRAAEIGAFPRAGRDEAATGQHLLSPRVRARRRRCNFRHAPIVVEGEYRFPAVYQYAMEPHTTIAQWGANLDEIQIWSSCQHPFLVRAEIADLFQLPVGRVRIEVPYLGGGFGSKSYTKMEPITVALARKARQAGADRQLRRRSDGHHPPPWDESMHADRRHRRRPPTCPRSARLVRHRRLCRQRSAGGRDRR